MISSKSFSAALVGSAVLFSLSAFADVAKPTYVTKQYPVKHAKGFIQSAKNFNFMMSSPRRSFVNTDAALPSTYSLRGKAGPVEDQGQCGSCWDFSLTSVLRGTWIMAGSDPGRLSFNYLLNCASDQQGCDGGDFTAAAWFVSPKGAPAYGSDGGEYTGASGSCVQAAPIASTADYKMLGAGGTTPAFKDIAYVIGVLHQPVSIDVAADDTWQNYAGGVYNGCSDESANDIDHMVVIEGYDCETSVDQSGNCVFDANGNLPNGVGTWLVRNSWGTSWGDNGYITTKATDSSGQRCNAVATDALYYDIKSSAAL
jgi:C1A family cysteine protease